MESESSKGDKVQAETRPASEQQSSQVTSSQYSIDTFSAQFPPTEWLHNPRYLKPADQGHPVSYSKKAHKNAGKDRRQVYAGESRKGSRPSDIRFSSQRYSTVPENLNEQAGASLRRRDDARPSSRHRTQHYGRLSKYMSSSSECLQYLGPVDYPPNVDADQLVYYESGRRRERRRHRHHRRDSLKLYEIEDLGQLPVSEPFVESDGASGGERGTRTAAQYEHFNAGIGKTTPLVAPPTTTDLDTTATGDGTSGCRTSTPTERRVEPQTQPGQDSTMKAVKGENNCSDSAFSASPAVTDLSHDHDSNKYSSWGSGSDERNPASGEHADNSFNNHTYVNLNSGEQPKKTEQVEPEEHNQPHRTNRTYENCYGHESTQFENVTDITLANSDMEITTAKTSKLKLNETNASNTSSKKAAYISQV